MVYWDGNLAFAYSREDTGLDLLIHEVNFFKTKKWNSEYILILKIKNCG